MNFIELNNNNWINNKLNKMSYKSVDIKNSNEINVKKIYFIFKILKILKNQIFKIFSIVFYIICNFLCFKL